MARVTEVVHSGNADTAAVRETQAVQIEELSEGEFIDGNEENVKKKMKMFYRKQCLGEHSQIIHDIKSTKDNKFRNEYNLSKHIKDA